ncbi:MAG: Asp-tRNA(Asn)/Glu-tRNA(Gln) amidotransferase subunit GatB [Candidatus Pacebacteria bacterium]|nr:Asp-tRNA(Asn)/Glu-tRNA(Gln) amidotransferase subunit GatB [Candidatus Paceibacterota bacterium]
MEYTPTIGLEIHAELKTKTKMFCDSKNDPNEREPNVNICSVCMAHPGALPVINREAVKHVLRVGLALGGELADFTEFDRKNYFYPDIPKGYQISQYKHPLISGGSLNGIELTRIHLEEDTARSTHDKGERSLVDFNRAGIPLMELVTEPVISNAIDAGNFARELQLLLRYLKASDANMEKGEMRVEANISVSKTGEKGTKVEVKNLNSFRSVERAIAYETRRQIEVLESGGTVVQETRGWDENKQETFSQRMKEESHDYRYMPDPDLPKLRISEIRDFEKSELTKELPELPWENRRRYVEEYGMKPEDAELFVHDMGVLKRLLEEHVIPAFKDDKKRFGLAVNYIASDIVGTLSRMGESARELGENFVELITMVDEGLLSSRGAKDTLATLLVEGGSAKEVAEDKGLLQESNEGKIALLVDEIIEENPEAVKEYKEGKEASLKFLVGQGMKKSSGSANPQILSKLLIEKMS